MSMEFYRGMLIQKSRMNAFGSHIADVVRPGDLVLEVGAGLGTYSFFTARAGAAKVLAIESGSVIEAAKSVAIMNGLDDRIEFLRGRFPTVGPSEPVDVAIFEDFPAQLLGSEAYRVITAIHRYALKLGGLLIPDRVKLFAAPVMAEESWEVLRPFGGERDMAYDIDWSTTREYAFNKPPELPLRAQDLRGPPAELADVSFATPPDSRDLGGESTWTFEEDTEINGFAYWFDV